MELPIAKQTYQPTTDTLIRAAKRATLMLGRAIARETALNGGVALSNRDRPHVAAANFAGEVTAPDHLTPREAIDQLMAHYSDQGLACYALDSAQTYWHDALPPILSSLGYFPSNRLVCLLERYAPPSPDRCNDRLQIIPARAAYGELRAFFMEMAATQDRADADTAAAVAQARVDQLDEPQLELFLGRLDGRPVGVAGVCTLGNIGVLYDLFTLSRVRKQGIGATLMDYLIDHCTRAQFAQVIASFPQNCPHLPFYQAIGFRSLGTFIRFRRRSA